MIIKKADLAALAAWKSQYPPELTIDIVLAGRSNVGKSSLINRLLNRKALARTSSNPGKTRTLNFYSVNDAWYFVDLPGYGYAKVSLEEREAFKKMVNRYLETPRRREFWQLIDARHKPGELDQQMSAYLRSVGIPYLIVATKADKLSKNQIAKQKKIIMQELALNESELVFFSATTGLNRDLLLARIAEQIEKDNGKEKARD